MKTPPLPLALASSLAALLLAASLIAADDNATTIAFGNPSAPRALRLEVFSADVRIAGADVDRVSVRSSAPPAGRHSRRSDGLRVIAGNGTYELSERDNVVTLTQAASSAQGGSAFELTVPRDTSVTVKIATNGDAAIRDVAGDIEVSNLNGSVRLENVGGGVAVDTMNGEISARYAALTAGKPHAFSSMNGEIRLFVPPAAKATFRLRAQNGTVATDFDESALVTRTEGRPTGPHSVSDGLHIGMDAARAGIETARAAVEMARAITRESLQELRDEAVETDDGKAPRAPKPPKAPRPPRPRFPTFPAFGGQVVTGTLNGGGVEIRVTTMNGEIQLREAKEALPQGENVLHPTGGNSRGHQGERAKP